MNHDKLKTAAGVIGAGAILLATAAIPAFAQVTTAVSVTATTSVGGQGANVVLRTSASGTLRADRETQVIARATTEITDRVNALTALDARVNAMQKLSSEEKASLSSSIQAQIMAMTTLQGQISTDETSNSTSSLKTDIQSITKSYRIYALILPQGEIAAASDRVMTIASAMTTFAGDLQTRIAAAQNAGANMTASVSALADLDAKVTDANVQAQAAVGATASLQPDNGVTSVMQSNTMALKSARTDIQTARQDLIAARADATAIIAAIKAAEKISASATGTGQ